MPNCPRCHAQLPDRGLSICRNCGASFHLHNGQIDAQLGGTPNLRPLGLLAARWAHVVHHVSQ